MSLLARFTQWRRDRQWARERRILVEFLSQEDQYGFGLMRSIGVPAGHLYPLLARLEARGWIERRWEEIDEEAEGRPRRTLYRLTPRGLSGVRSELESRPPTP